ncbi:MAG: DUF5671 domain-containing protein, partial [Candidatus Liptonbacteria bacterium]
MVTLYASAISFLTLSFQIINYFIPDQLVNYSGYTQGVLDAIRWSISVLIVMFPAYLVTLRFVNKGYAEDPSRRALRIRKWLTYFTLFVAALIILGDIVVLLNILMQGELTVRVLLKILAVFFVAGSMLYYYLSDIRKQN